MVACRRGEGEARREPGPYGVLPEPGAPGAKLVPRTEGAAPPGASSPPDAAAAAQTARIPGGLVPRFPASRFPLPVPRSPFPRPPTSRPSDPGTAAAHILRDTPAAVLDCSPTPMAASAGGK
ncbi:hypothetical protein GCM10018793_38150 [Streptomyces sulfonofaciens]|uniref:Uncharacterized protein n=1 Tax=Streptomyces sulfonofaciens TaxID=68272 RepID=A0A919GC63_9ACTN|nr:hypothetical protein GCM10018793_38150 [Streptomyces sulfonofaciens]